MFFGWIIEHPFVTRLVQPKLADIEHMHFAKCPVFHVHFEIYGRKFLRDTFAHNTDGIYGIDKNLRGTFE